MVRKFVGENETCWYVEKSSFFYRLFFHAILWLGGWEKTYWNGAAFFRKLEINKLNWNSPCPITIFRRLTIQPFGFSLETERHYYCWHWQGGFRNVLKFKVHCIHRSPDATPQHADVWYKNCPSEIIKDLQRPVECGGVRAS